MFFLLSKVPDLTKKIDIICEISDKRACKSLEEKELYKDE